jgi:hypothetical protein
LQCGQGKDVGSVDGKRRLDVEKIGKDKIVLERLSFCKRGDQHLGRYMRVFRRQTEKTLVTDLRSERCISDRRTEYVVGGR